MEKKIYLGKKMIRIYPIYSVLFFLIFWASCKPDSWKKKVVDDYKEVISSSGDLSDEQVVKYIAVVRDLHKLGPSIPEKIAGNEGDPNLGNDVYYEIEKTIKKGGFKDYPEFVKVNAKIAWAWNISQGQKGVQDFQTMKDIGVSKIKETLDNPNVPEETKTELRRTLMEIEENWAKNKKYADLTLNFIKPFTNENDLAVIKRHQKDLMEGFTGRKMDELIQINPNLFLSDFHPKEF